MQVQPYLFFDGRFEEAVEFYKSKLDAKVEMLMRTATAREQGTRDLLDNLEAELGADRSHRKKN